LASRSGSPLYAGLLIGIVSALPLFTMKLGAMLHDSTRSGTRGRAVRTTSRTLVVAQMACSFVLLVGSALLWISIRNLLAVDAGFTTDRVVSGLINAARPRYSSDDAARAFIGDRSPRFVNSLASPASEPRPWSASARTPRTDRARRRLRSPAWRTAGRRGSRGTGSRRTLLRRTDALPSSRTIIIDEQLAERFWPGQDAIGRRMNWMPNPSQVDTDASWLTVVGVVRRAQLRGPGVNDIATGTRHVLRAVGDNGAAQFRLRDPHAGRAHRYRQRGARRSRAHRSRDPALRRQDVVGTRGAGADAAANTMHLATMFAAIRRVLSALGLYGVLAYVVAQRRVRWACAGARQRSQAIIGLVLREGLALAMAGIALGIAGPSFGPLRRVAAVRRRAIRPFRHGTDGDHPERCRRVRCIVPARRAANVDVMKILSAP
jgi:hypothetical protein